MVPSPRLQQNKEEVWRDMDGMTKKTMGLYQEIGSSVKGVGVREGLLQAGCYRAQHETGESKWRTWGILKISTSDPDWSSNYKSLV